MAEQGQEYEQYTPQTSGKLFNNAMFGFSKEEVLEYLEELAEENAHRQAAADQQIADLNATIHALEERAAALEAHVGAPQEVQVQQVQVPVTDGRYEAVQHELEQVRSDLEIVKEASQQAEEELQDYKEHLFNAQKENAWLREEYQKSDNVIADLRRQLDDASAGQWTDAEAQIAELRAQLEETNAALRIAEENLAASQSSQAEYTADTIIAEANEQADQIREEAWAEKDRLHRQIINSAGGLAASISNLRSEVSVVEGDISGVLESVQQSLAEVLAALGRTEQNLETLGIQVDRFPQSAPSVQKPQQQVVYFQPGADITVTPPRKGAASRATPAQSYGTGNFRRVWPDAETARNNAATNSTVSSSFRPTHTDHSAVLSSAYHSPGAEAYQPEEVQNPEEDRMRGLAESLVDTLVQMMH